MLSIKSNLFGGAVGAPFRKLAEERVPLETQIFNLLKCNYKKYTPALLLRCYVTAQRPGKLGLEG